MILLKLFYLKNHDIIEKIIAQDKKNKWNISSTQNKNNYSEKCTKHRQKYPSPPQLITKTSYIRDRKSLKAPKYEGTSYFFT